MKLEPGCEETPIPNRTSKLPVSPRTSALGEASLFCRLIQGVFSRIRTAVLGCEGSLLIESVVAIMVFALVGVAVMEGISASRHNGSLVERKSIGERIARNQMENVFNSAYIPPQSTPYPTIIPPPGYTVSVVADELIPLAVEVEIVTVTVTRDGKDILTLQTLRTNAD